MTEPKEIREWLKEETKSWSFRLQYHKGLNINAKKKGEKGYWKNEIGKDRQAIKMIDALLSMLAERERGGVSEREREVLDKFLITMMSYMKTYYEDNGIRWSDFDEKRFTEIRALILGSRGGAVTKADVFVKHIENHLRGLGHKVVCKICNKTIDEIFREAVVAGEEKADETKR